jgi:uncharacterized RDD family membrane protein YckC
MTLSSIRYGLRNFLLLFIFVTLSSGSGGDAAQRHGSVPKTTTRQVAAAPSPKMIVSKGESLMIYERASLVRRCFAFILDTGLEIGFMFVFCAKMFALNENPVVDLALKSYILNKIGSILCRLFIAIPAMQATPGKYLLGLRVVGEKGKKLTYKQLAVHILAREGLCIIFAIANVLMLGSKSFVYRKANRSFEHNLYFSLSLSFTNLVSMCLIIFSVFSNVDSQAFHNIMAGSYVVRCVKIKIRSDRV